MKPTDTANPDYYHRVVDCQWACPAHTPVPEYIRLIAARRYTDAYMMNWWSNVFPGILGRTCDRPCEPACRRDRVDACGRFAAREDEIESVQITQESLASYSDAIMNSFRRSVEAIRIYLHENRIDAALWY